MYSSKISLFCTEIGRSVTLEEDLEQKSCQLQKCRSRFDLPNEINFGAFGPHMPFLNSLKLSDFQVNTIFQGNHTLNIFY